jgi:hypothetical protein
MKGGLGSIFRVLSCPKHWPQLPQVFATLEPVPISHRFVVFFVFGKGFFCVHNNSTHTNVRMGKDKEEGPARHGEDGSASGARAGVFLGTALMDTLAARQGLVSSRVASSRTVFEPSDTSWAGRALLGEHSVDRTVFGLHAQALKILVPFAALAAVLTAALTSILTEACASPKKFHSALSAAAAVAERDPGQAPDFPLFVEVADELRRLRSSHGGLWGYLQSLLIVPATLPQDGFFGGRALADWHRILRVCENSSIATALLHAPNTEKVSAFLERISYGMDDCTLDPECIWFARTCLRGESAAGTPDAAKTDKIIAQETRKAFAALGAAQQRVNEVHKVGGGRVVVVFCPASGPLELVQEGSGHRVTPGETSSRGESTRASAYSHAS